MSPSILTLVFHLGAIVGAGKDVEKTIEDLFNKKNIAADVQQDLKDVAVLFSDGVIPLPPGMSLEQVNQAIQSLATV